MKSQVKYDVLIVGSGPAGALLGYLLARNSAKVLIIEKATLPRYKPCGGGLTKKALGALPFNISEIIEDYTYTANIFVYNELVFTKTLADPIIGMVMRNKFDHFLVRKAINAGATLQQDTNFKSLSGSIGNLSVGTSKGVFNTRIIVGADGVNSRVARSLDLRVRRNVMNGIEGEVFYENAEVVSRLKNSVHFDFGVIPYGYGWIFPKKDHLSIGVLTTSKKVKNVTRYFTSYLKMKGLSNFKQVEPLSSHLLPFGPEKKNVVANQKGLLVGDAVGLSDPITGEGIFYAIREAHLASEIMMNALESGYEYIESYNNILKDELMHELICAKRMSYMLYKVPSLSYKVLKSHGKKLGKYHVDIITGEKTYSDLQHKILRLSSLLTLLFNRS